MRTNDLQRAIIEQLLGITIPRKSRTVKRTDPSKLKMLLPEENAKIQCYTKSQTKKYKVLLKD